MKGGYQIIDIRKLNLTLSNSTQSITDAEILQQLRSLRAYIQKGHDFTKPLDNALKCIQIRYRDQKNGEKLEACQWANIETSNNSLTYEIKTKNLMIEIVFEEKTDEYSNKYYDIKTAKYLYNHNEIIEGNLTVGGGLTVGDEAKFEEDVDMDKDLNVDGDLTVTGSINGEANPSIKPVYYHPISIWSKTNDDNPINSLSMSLVILGNRAEQFTLNRLDLFIQWCRANNITYLAPCSGFAYNGTKQMIIAWVDIGEDYINIRGHLIDDTTNGALKSVMIHDTDFGNYNLDDTGVNKIN